MFFHDSIFLVIQFFHVQHSCLSAFLPDAKHATLKAFVLWFALAITNNETLVLFPRPIMICGGDPIAVTVFSQDQRRQQRPFMWLLGFSLIIVVCGGQYYLKVLSKDFTELVQHSKSSGGGSGSGNSGSSSSSLSLNAING